jgi:hypothetical protein
LPPAKSAAPAGTEVAPEPAVKDQTEKSEASSETLFSQFQAWAAAQDAQKQSEAEQPVQDAAKIMQDEPARVAKRIRGPSRQAQKRQPVRAVVRNARAEVRPQNVRRHVPQAQTARAPVQDPRAQDAAAQEAQTAPFLGIFGQRN